MNSGKNMGIEKAYNAWAKQYDTDENLTRDLDIQSTIETLDKYKFGNVIELGCGTGKNTSWLLKKAKKIISIDFSQEMLNLAEAKIKDDRVRFVKANLNDDWAIESDFADLITCSLTLEHIKDFNHIFTQANQKLKKNGLFFISELHPYKQYTGSKAKYETKSGITELQVFVHHTSEYLDNAINNNFDLIELKEWFDEKSETKIPRLISFVFKKR